VPETIHDIIAARVDRLEESLKETLQPAAVVGRQFAVPLVSRVLRAEADIAPRFSTLHGLDFVFPSGVGAEPAYTFKHALTQEVVYAGLLERRRRIYHADIAAALEDIHAARIDDVVELLAYHYERSADDGHAVDYAIRAGKKAQRRWANSEALAHFETALKRLQAMPDTAPNRLRRIDAVIKQAEIKFALGKHAEHVQALETIRALVDESADPPRRAAWYYWAGFLHSLTGARPEVSLGYCRTALEIADAAGLDDLRAYAECALAHVHYYTGDLANTFAAGERALALFEERGNLWWACRALFALGPAANAAGDWERALAYCGKMVDYGIQTDDLRLKVSSWWRSGEAYLRKGDTAEGLRCCDEALALSPAPFDAAMINSTRGLGLLQRGDAKAAADAVTAAVDWFAGAGLRYTAAWCSLRLAETHLAQGDTTQARAVAEASLETIRKGGARYAEGIAARIVGESMVAADAPAAAAHLDLAVAILDEIGARPELARALAARGLLHERRGDRASARAALERALAIVETAGTPQDRQRIRAALDRLPA
jgi:tetratricopeptide (TPR) repeat protein